MISGKPVKSSIARTVRPAAVGRLGRPAGLDELDVERRQAPSRTRRCRSCPTRRAARVGSRTSPGCCHRGAHDSHEAISTRRGLSGSIRTASRAMSRTASQSRSCSIGRSAVRTSWASVACGRSSARWRGSRGRSRRPRRRSAPSPRTPSHRRRWPARPSRSRGRRAAGPGWTLIALGEAVEERGAEQLHEAGQHHDGAPARDRATPRSHPDEFLDRPVDALNDPRRCPPAVGRCRGGAGVARASMRWRRGDGRCPKGRSRQRGERREPPVLDLCRSRGRCPGSS